jgi:hypothetical protein
MYEGDWVTKEEPPNSAKLESYQILINYCFHHPNSSVYLHPYSSGINLINHNRTQANVRVQWPRDGDIGFKETLIQVNPKEYLERATPGLFFDYVAMRDIMPGDEIFLDYGDAWDAAWEAHAKNWGKEQKHSENYQLAREWNKMNANAVLRTAAEQAEDPYPSNFEMRCLKPRHGAFEWKRETPGIRCKILERDKINNGAIVYKVLYLDDGEWGLTPSTVQSKAGRFAN